MVLWAEKYDIMVRKWAERSLGGCSSPLSHTCQQYFPSSHPSPTEAPGWSTQLTFFSFENWQSLFCWLTQIAIYFPHQHRWFLPVQSNRGSRLINFSNFFSLLKIGNPSLFLSPSFPLSVHQISRDRRHSFANLTFQHTLIHFGGRLLLSIETFTLPPLQLLNLLEGIWSDRRGGRTLDAHSSLPFCGLHSRANLANRFREHLSLFHIL